jgi:hypothetical protein
MEIAPFSMPLFLVTGMAKSITGLVVQSFLHPQFSAVKSTQVKSAILYSTTWKMRFVTGEKILISMLGLELSVFNVLTHCSNHTSTVAEVLIKDLWFHL